MRTILALVTLVFAGFSQTASAQNFAAMNLQCYKHGGNIEVFQTCNDLTINAGVYYKMYKWAEEGAGVAYEHNNFHMGRLQEESARRFRKQYVEAMKEIEQKFPKVWAVVFAPERPQPNAPKPR
jgi:hypothetical protein